MRAEFDGQDFALYLDLKQRELNKLGAQRLESQLQQPFGGEDLGKLITLEFWENEGPDGIELKYFPKDFGSWEQVEIIRVTMNHRAYRHVKERGSFGTRCNGSDKIEIINGLPDVPMFS